MVYDGYRRVSMSFTEPNLRLATGYICNGWNTDNHTRRRTFWSSTLKIRKYSFAPRVEPDSALGFPASL